MNVARPIAPITLEEFEVMDKDERLNYELINGVVMMSPKPTLLHQIISGNLYYALRQLLKDTGCIPIQEIDLVIANNDNLEPDLVVICEEIETLTQMKRYTKPPLIVMEILSPSSASRDYITKRHKYEQFGVKEYWIISPEEKCVTVYDFTTDTHELYCSGQVKSAVMPEIQINTDKIFAE